MADDTSPPRRRLPRTGRLLVIADESEVLDAVTAYFARLDYETQAALALQGAAAVIDSRRPDVILLDVQMPRLADVLRELRARCPKIPLLVATDSAESARHLRTLGAVACVRRPFVWEALRVRVAIAIDAALRARAHPLPA